MRYGRLSAYVFVVLWLVGAAAVAQNTNPSGTDCGEPVESNVGGEAWEGWAQNQTVLVSIDTSTLTTTQQQMIVNTLNNWSGVGGVNFQITYNNPAVGLSNQGTYAFSGAHFGYIPGGTNNGGQSDGGPGPDGHMYSADSVMNSDMPDAIFQNRVSHEIGHSFGLNDNDTPAGTGSAMANDCDYTTCGSPGPTLTDMNAADCEDYYNGNQCLDPSNSQSPACLCGPGTSGQCSGGLVCGGDGVCGCTDPCDDPYCEGWDSSCGTCRDDGDCGGGLTCSNGQCVQGGTGGCTTDSDCPGGLVCQASGSCGCSDICDDPSCDPNYVDDCEGGGGGGGGGGGCYDICDPGCVDYNGCGGGCTCEQGCNGGDALPVSTEIDAQPFADPLAPSAIKKESVHPLCE